MSGAPPESEAGCMGDGLVVSATYLTATFGGASAHYSLWLGQPCSSTVVVHVLFLLDAYRSLKVSSDRLCFTPENCREPQLVRVDVMDHYSHSSVISHRVFSLDKNFDRIATPSVVVKTEWTGVASVLTFGGPVSKRKAAVEGSKLTVVDLRRAIPTLPLLGAAPKTTDTTSSSSDSTTGDERPTLFSPLDQDPLWFVCEMACGHGFSLAVTMHQTPLLFSWGLNANGELGRGSSNAAGANPEPQLVTALPRQVHGDVVTVLAVSCGKHHAAVVTSHAKLFTWGHNKYGQLGLGDYATRTEPHEVHFALAVLSSHQRALRLRHTIRERGGGGGGGGTNVTQAACGAFHTLFVTHQQTVLAMGYNQAGQLGLGHRLQQHMSWRSCVPAAVETLRDRSILDVAAGQNHSACVLSNGAVYTWGCSDDGRLGVGLRGDCAMRPVLVRSLHESGVRVRNVRCGARHTAALSDRDVLFVWGANEFGQLGCGDTKPRFKPVAVTAPRALIVDGVADVALGEFHSVCVTCTGRALAWGLDLGGDSDQHTSPTPVVLPKGERAQRVSCGWSHTNIVTQNSSNSSSASRGDRNDEAVRSQSSTSTLGSGSEPPLSRSFQRTLERKLLAQRTDELVRWKAFAAPSGLTVVERPPVGWRASPVRTAKSASSATHASNQSDDTSALRQSPTAAARRRRVATTFVASVLRSATRVCVERHNQAVARYVPVGASGLVGSCHRVSLSHTLLYATCAFRPRSSPTRETREEEVPTPTRGIFYHNPLHHPPELPPPSTVALESRLAVRHRHHQQRQQRYHLEHPDHGCRQHPPLLLHECVANPRANQHRSINSTPSSNERDLTVSPIARRPYRPQSCSNTTRANPPAWSPRDYRTFVTSPSHHLQSPSPSLRFFQLQGSLVPPTTQEARVASQALQLGSPTNPKQTYSPRAPTPALGAVETLMHRPSYSIAQAVVARASSSRQRVQDQGHHNTSVLQ